MIVELIRHGETSWGAEGRYLSYTDQSLSQRGQMAIQPSKNYVKMVYTSSLSRTAETAMILFPGAVQISVPEFDEINFGKFEGHNFLELNEDPYYQAWIDCMCEGYCPGGESKSAFCDRVCTAFVNLMARALNKGEKYLTIVAHDGTLMAILDRFAFPHREYFDWHTDCATGYRMDASTWEIRKTLRLIGRTNYQKEG